MYMSGSGHQEDIFSTVTLLGILGNECLDFSLEISYQMGVTSSSFVFLLVRDYKRGSDVRVLERKGDTPRKWAGGKPAATGGC